MELAQYHSLERRTPSDVASELRAMLPPGALHRAATLGVACAGPWRPADRWPGAIERVAWTVAVESEGHVLSERGERWLGRSSERRHAPAHVVEALARRAGEGLVILHSDAAKLAYVAVYRERRVSFSLLLQDHVQVVRCDGNVVMREAPPRFVPEVDRAGVLLAGLHRWLREPVPVRPEEHLVLADELAALTAEVPVHWIVRDGCWVDGDGATRAARASAG